MDQLLKGLSISEDGEMDEAQRLVNVELVRIMRRNSIAHPLPGTSLPGGTVSSYEMPPDNAIAAALSEIHLEFVGSLGFPNANWEQVRESIVALSKAELDQGMYWAHDQGELIWHMTSWAPLDSDNERTTIYNAVSSTFKAASDTLPSIAGENSHMYCDSPDDMPTPTLTHSPSSTESSSGDRMIHMASFVDDLGANRCF
jgi:hypothetical protein